MTISVRFSDNPKQYYRERYQLNKERFRLMALMRKDAINARRRERLRNRDPKIIYQKQRWQARKRGIGWEFTFSSWWEMWSSSGRWSQRGRGMDKYCMCRYGDVGPYSPDNCYIDLFSTNSSRKPRCQTQR